MLFALLASVCGLPAADPAVCDPKTFQGAYGFLLSGDTSIGGRIRPVAVVGRLAFHSGGKVSGVSSASFTGLVLGNPVTGSYEAYADCSVKWRLQDDSGTFQHFTGTMTVDGARVSFQQTDPGAARHGAMLRTMNDCAQSSLAGELSVSLSGATVDVDSGIESGTASRRALVTADGAGALFIPGSADELPRKTGTYDVRRDCFVELVLYLPGEAEQGRTTHFRAILGEEGREALGIQTDPGTVVAIRLLVR